MNRQSRAERLKTILSKAHLGGLEHAFSTLFTLKGSFFSSFLMRPELERKPTRLQTARDRLLELFSDFRTWLLQPYNAAWLRF